MLLRLLGIGVAYGFGFMFVKSLFPEPFILLIMQGGQSSEGDLTTLALVYMGVGMLSGLIAAPLFGGALLLRRGSDEESSGPRLILSLALALLTGTISGILTLLVYAYGILPPGGVLDPLKLVRNSVHSAPGVGLLIAWTIARDLLPAGLAGPNKEATKNTISKRWRSQRARLLWRLSARSGYASTFSTLRP